MATAGYSGAPLAKKLGIEPGHRVALLHEPPELLGLLEPLPDDITFQHGLDPAPDVAVGLLHRERRRAEVVVGAAVEKGAA